MLEWEGNLQCNKSAIIGRRGGGGDSFILAI